MNEIWKSINGFPDYQISNFGRVKSLKFRKERILKSNKDSYGYLYVVLSKYGKTRNKSIHRLVLETFNPIDDMDSLECNHKDGIKINNSLYNLEWSTSSKNCQHAFKIGLKNMNGRILSDETKKKISKSHKGKKLSEDHKIKISKKTKGENNPNSKLTNKKVSEIKKVILENRLTDQEIANLFRTSRSTISNIKHGRTWNYIK